VRRIALSKTSSNIKVYNAEIRQHQCELIRQVNTRGILCEQANSKPHHYPSAIADLISGCPSKYPACSALSQPHVIGHRRIHIYHGLFYRATEISTTASEQYLHRTQYISCGYFLIFNCYCPTVGDTSVRNVGHHLTVWHNHSTADIVLGNAICFWGGGCSCYLQKRVLSTVFMAAYNSWDIYCRG